MNRFEAFLGGHPITIDDLLYIQSALFDGIKAASSPWQFGGSDACILAGIFGTVVGPNTVFTAGYIAVNNEVYYVPGATIPAGGGCIDITQSIDPAGDVIYEDLTPRSTYLVRQGVIKTMVGGPNEIDLADFISVGQRIVQLTNAVVSQLTGWTNISFQGDWVSSGGSFGSARYRKNALGHIELDGSTNNLDTSTGHLIVQLPVGYRPTKKHTVVVAAEVNLVGTYARLLIESTGDVTYLGTSGDEVYYLCLGGISFPIT